MAFNLNSYEYNCYHHKYEEAARQLIDFLRDLDSDLGKLTEKFTANVPALAINDQLTEHFLSRIISATTFLFLQKDFNLAESGVLQMIYLQRWIEILFAASPYRNADHIIQGLNQREDPNNPVISAENLAKFAMLYLPDSNVPLNFDELWKVNRDLTAQLCFALLSPRFLGTQSAHDKRELLLRWLPEKLYELDSLENLPISVLHDVYMHCSYADYPLKHSIKRPLNYLMRRQLEKANIDDVRDLPTSIKQGEKPVLLVLLEWFSGGHSIYRTHSRCIEEAKKEFYVIGMGLSNRIGKETLHVFDEYIEIKEDMGLFEQVRYVRDFCQERKPHVFYMPAIGMFLNTIFMTVLKLAPVQMVALGHPATTNSPYIDYTVVEDIYVGEDTPDCFSEELLRLPVDIFYRPSMFAQNLELKGKREFDPEVVNIVMAATIMKFNPIMLDTLKQIITRSKKKIHIHFLIGQAIGLMHMHVKNVIERALGKEHITVHEHQNYKEYMQIMDKCDMFLNPFPFGNTNGIVDTITAGLPGICKTGPEVNEHIDEGLFRYLDFPEWTICKTTEEYVESALRMIENPLDRYTIATNFSGPDKVQKFFKGDASCLGKMMRERLDKRLEEMRNGTAYIPTIEDLKVFKPALWDKYGPHVQNQHTSGQVTEENMTSEVHPQNNNVIETPIHTTTTSIVPTTAPVSTDTKSASASTASSESSSSTTKNSKRRRVPEPVVTPKFADLNKKSQKNPEETKQVKTVTKTENKKIAQNSSTKSNKDSKSSRANKKQSTIKSVSNRPPKTEKATD